MWREYDDQGFLVYSFAESVAAMFPYYVMRAAGGATVPRRRARNGLQRNKMTHPRRVRDETAALDAAPLPAPAE